MEAVASFDNTGKYNKDIAKSNLKANLGITDADIKENGNGTLIVKLDGYEFRVDNKGNVTFSITVAEAKEQGKTFSDNTILTDTYGNTITIPEGFKIASDSATEVAQGVVIEDATYEGTKGSQFVWIPVGTVTGKVNGVEKTETITLGRYVFDSSGNIDTTLSVANPSDQLKTSSTSSLYYIEGLKNETTTNAHAKDIEAFITSANNNGGYYIGRYEAGDSIEISARTDSTSDSNQMVCKSGAQVYNYVTQSQASSLSQGMYTSTQFTSDLINSYAWSTAIVFIQEFGEESNSSTYSRVEGRSLININEPQTTGTNILSATNLVDKQCNIFDMAGNTYEWTTETYSNPDYSCTLRGSYYSGDSYYTSSHNRYSTAPSFSHLAFRPILYL